MHCLWEWRGRGRPFSKMGESLLYLIQLLLCCLVPPWLPYNGPACESPSSEGQFLFLPLSPEPTACWAEGYFPISFILVLDSTSEAIKNTYCPFPLRSPYGIWRICRSIFFRETWPTPLTFPHGMWFKFLGIHTIFLGLSAWLAGLYFKAWPPGLDAVPFCVAWCGAQQCRHTFLMLETTAHAVYDRTRLSQEPL